MCVKHFQVAGREVLNVSVSNTGNFYWKAPKWRLVQITHIYEGYAACIVERGGAYRILVGRPEGKRPLGRPSLRWEVDIKMDIQDKHNCIDLVYLVSVRYYHMFRLSTSGRSSTTKKKGRGLFFTNQGLCPFHSSCVPVSYCWWLICTAEACGSKQYTRAIVFIG